MQLYGSGGALCGGRMREVTGSGGEREGYQGGTREAPVGLAFGC